MKPLPPALLHCLSHPTGDPVAWRDALTIWAHLYYGMDYDSAKNAPGYREALRRAEKDLLPLAMTKAIPARARHTVSNGFAPDWWAIGGNFPTKPTGSPNATRTIPVAIAPAALVAFMADHGIELDGVASPPQPKPQPATRAKGRPSINQDAYDYIDRRAGGLSEACLDAVAVFFQTHQNPGAKAKSLQIGYTQWKNKPR